MTLVPQKVDLEKAVADGTITFAELLAALAQQEAEEQAQQPSAPAEKPKPKSIVLSEKARVLLRTIPIELANLTLPAEPRRLSEEESAKAIPLYVDLKSVAKALETAESAIKEAFHNDIDQKAPEGAPVDAHGHYLSEGEINVPGLDNKIVRGLRGGKPAGVTEADLAELESEGLIDHATYLALTVSVPATRTLAPSDKIMAVLKKRPELVKVLASKSRLTPQTSAITIGKTD